jgi:hypothetical protein
MSSSTHDADLFVIIRLFGPDGAEVVFNRAPFDPHTPIAEGWLRASHRKLDPRLSTEYRPYHSHETFQPLDPGKMILVDGHHRAIAAKKLGIKMLDAYVIEVNEKY